MDVPDESVYVDVIEKERSAVSLRSSLLLLDWSRDAFSVMRTGSSIAFLHDIGSRLIIMVQ